MSVEKPHFRVVRGVPTAEELAALVGALVSRSRSRPAAAPTPTAPSAWARSGRPGPVTPTAGTGAWRASGLPR